MILNRTAGGQKKYHILNQKALLLVNSEYAAAGQIVGMGTFEKQVLYFGDSFVKTASGTIIPMGQGKVQGITFPDGRIHYYFVMPAEDVTIS